VTTLYPQTSFAGVGRGIQKKVLKGALFRQNCKKYWKGKLWKGALVSASDTHDVLGQYS